MVFDSFSAAQGALLWSTFVLAIIMGATANKTNFCTMGAVSDMVNIGDFGRLRAWGLAVAVAMLGVTLFEVAGLTLPDQAFPPYRGSNLLWAEYLLGGFTFGVGMTLASGCGNKTLVRIGGGNIKSILVFIIIAIIAYFMINPFPGSDQTLMSVLFLDWLRPLAISLKSKQDLGSLISAENSSAIRLALGILIASGLIWLAFRSKDFRQEKDNVVGGLIVGLVILGAWLISSNLMIDADGDNYSLLGYAQEWEFLAESEEGRPAETRPLSPQSFTFINPMGQTAGYLSAGANSVYLTFGIMAVFGVILGSLLWSLVTRKFRIEWFASVKDFINHFIGAILMGFGGVLGMGCTIGQGITGVSTLALGSFMTLGAIIFGSTLTMKIQYYRMIYENEASFLAALISSLVDLHLLPAKLRRLDAV